MSVDHWRTRVESHSGEDGSLVLNATLGTYVAHWDTVNGPVHVRFEVTGGEGVLDIVPVL